MSTHNLTPEQVRRFDAALTAALEHKPSVAVPAGFAARVAARVPARPAAIRTTHFGRTIAYASMLLLTMLLAWMYVTHPATANNLTSWSSLTELALMLELLAIGYFTEFAPAHE